MQATDLMAAVARGEQLSLGTGAPERPCLVNKTRTRARLGNLPVCQGCWARAQSAARKVPAEESAASDAIEVEPVCPDCLLPLSECAGSYQDSAGWWVHR